VGGVAIAVLAGILSAAGVVAMVWLFVWAAIQDGRDNRREHEAMGAGPPVPWQRAAARLRREPARRPGDGPSRRSAPGRRR